MPLSYCEARRKCLVFLLVFSFIKKKWRLKLPRYHYRGVNELSLSPSKLWTEFRRWHLQRYKNESSPFSELFFLRQAWKITSTVLSERVKSSPNRGVSFGQAASLKERCTDVGWTTFDRVSCKRRTTALKLALLPYCVKINKDLQNSLGHWQPI